MEGKSRKLKILLSVLLSCRIALPAGAAGNDLAPWLVCDKNPMRDTKVEIVRRLETLAEGVDKFFYFDGSPRDEKKSGAGELIIVPGHGVYVGEKKEETSIDDKWVGIFPGEGSFYTEHAKRAVELAAENPNAVIAFSGGMTRAKAEGRSEAASYLKICEQWDWWGHRDVASRVLIEDGARDSLENVMFSVLLFEKENGRLPESVKVVGWIFKAERFGLHAEAIGIPAEVFEYVGVNNPSGTALAPAVRGENNKVEQTRKDSLLEGENWVRQRSDRNPFHDDPELRYFKGLDLNGAARSIKDHYENVSKMNTARALRYKVGMFYKTFMTILTKSPGETFILALDSDIGADQKAQIMPIYKFMDGLQALRSASGNKVFPNLLVIRRSASNGGLMREIGDLLIGASGNAGMEYKIKKENIFLIVRQKNVENNIFGQLEGVSWITGIDDSLTADNYYLPAIEAVTLTLMAAAGADIKDVKSFYDGICAEPVTLDVLEGMMRKRTILLLPKAEEADLGLLRDRYEATALIYSAA